MMQRITLPDFVPAPIIVPGAIVASVLTLALAAL